MEQLALAEAIESIRQELAVAIAAGSDQDLQFEVGEIKIELSVGVERKVEGNAGLNIWVLQIGGGGAHSERATHKVVLPLKPVKSGGGPIMTGDGVIPD